MQTRAPAGSLGRLGGWTGGSPAPTRVSVDDVRSVESLFGVPTDDIVGCVDAADAASARRWEAAASSSWADFAEATVIAARDADADDGASAAMNSTTLDSRLGQGGFGVLPSPARSDPETSRLLARLAADPDGTCAGRGAGDSLDRAGVLPWIAAADDLALAAFGARRAAVAMLAARVAGAPGPAAPSGGFTATPTTDRGSLEAEAVIRDAGGAAKLVCLARLIESAEDAFTGDRHARDSRFGDSSGTGGRSRADEASDAALHAPAAGAAAAAASGTAGGPGAGSGSRSGGHALEPGGRNAGHGGMGGSPSHRMGAADADSPAAAGDSAVQLTADVLTQSGPRPVVAVSRALLSVLLRAEARTGASRRAAASLSAEGARSAPRRAGLLAASTLGAASASPAAGTPTEWEGEEGGPGSPASPSSATLSRVLLEDAAWSLLQSSSPRVASEWEIRESLHPHHHACDYASSVAVPGASAIHISFDPRCALAPKARLVFYADPALLRPLAVFPSATAATSHSKGFGPFLAHSDRVWYRMRASGPQNPSGIGAPGTPWGFRFRVSPLWGVQWLCEAQALRAPSLGWATSLLDLVLQQSGGVSLAAYSPAFVGALVTYLRSPGLPCKSEVVRRLTALLRRPLHFLRREVAVQSASAMAGSSSAQSADDGAVVAVPVLPSALSRFGRHCAATSTTAPPLVVTGGVDLSQVRRLEAEVAARVGAAVQTASRSRGAAPVPTALQELAELCATSRAAEQAMARRDAASTIVTVDRSLGLEKFERTPPAANPRHGSATGLAIIANLAALRVLSATVLAGTPPPSEWIMLIASLAATGRESDPSRVPSSWIKHAVRACSSFGGSTDAAIVRLAVDVARSDGGVTAAGRSATSPLDLAASALAVPADRRELYPRLAAARPQELCCRFALLQMLNRVVATCIDFVAAAEEEDDDSTAVGTSGTTLASGSSHDPDLDDLAGDAETEAAEAAGAEGAPSSAHGPKRGHGRTVSTAGSEAGSQSEESVSALPLGVVMRRLGGLVLPETKTRLVEEAIDASWERNRLPTMSVVIDNALAFQSVDAGVTDSAISTCVFVQAFEQLSRWPASRFREHLDSRERLFVVSYKGEDGVDWGGLYREALTRAVEDLFPPAGAASAVGTAMAAKTPDAAGPGVGSAAAAAAGGQDADGSAGASVVGGLRSWLASLAGKELTPTPAPGAGAGPPGTPSAAAAAHSASDAKAGTGLGIDLFLPTPNARSGAGPGQEKCLPNPRLTGPRQLRMFEFVGRLMGLSMRQRIFLPFELPPLVWKVLAGDTAGMSVRDIAECDVATATLIERALAAADGRGGRVPGLCFSVATSDGSLVDLLPGGSAARVETRADHRRWAALALRRRLGEFEPQLTAMRTGLLGVVPPRAVRMCSWSELEVFVCGDARVDVDALAEHTVCEGYGPSDRPLRLLFRCLRGMSQQDRSRFIRFVWGRSRLPRGNRWPRPFKVSRHFGGDQSLPVAHSCFFQLELPPYSSEAVLRRRLMTALDYGMDSFLLA